MQWGGQMHRRIGVHHTCRFLKSSPSLTKHYKVGAGGRHLSLALGRGSLPKKSRLLPGLAFAHAEPTSSRGAVAEEAMTSGISVRVLMVAVMETEMKVSTFGPN